MIQTLVVNVFWLIKDMFLFLQREITQIGRKNDLVSESGESRASIRHQRRRNLAAVSLETRMFVNFGAYSEWWKIKCFLSLSDFRFTIRQNKHIF